MSQVTIQGGLIEFAFHNQLKLKSETKTLAGAHTLDKKSATLQFIDPGGAARTITLPAEADSDGLVFIVMNTADALEILTIQDDTPATVVTPTQNEMAIVVCDGTTWRGFTAIEA